MRIFLIPLAATVALFFAAQEPALAQGNKTGHESTSQSTQGNSGKTNDNANENNQGQTTTTTTGPKGQLDKGNTGCNNCDTQVTDQPGAKR